MRRFLTSLLCFLTLSVVFGFDIPKSVAEKFEGRTLSPIEGAWLWNSGALVVIESDSHGAVTLTLVDSPDPLQETPRIIGHGSFTGSTNSYKVELIADGSVARPSATHRTVKFLATVSDNHISLKPYSTGLKVNLWRLVPYLFRFSITSQGEPSGTLGAVRVLPSTGSPELPVIL